MYRARFPGRKFILCSAHEKMEISPDDHRPAHSGYFNPLVALVAAVGLPVLFAASGAAEGLELLAVRQLQRIELRETEA